MKCKPIILLWLPVGLVALVLIFVGIVLEALRDLFDFLQHHLDRVERRLIDWMSSVDPNNS